MAVEIGAEAAQIPEMEYITELPLQCGSILEARFVYVKT